MVRPSLFFAWFATAVLGLALALLAEGDVTRFVEAPAAQVADVAAEAIVLPAVAAAPPSVEAPAIEAPAPELDPTLSPIYEFFEGRHTGLTEAELDRVAETIAREAEHHGLEIALVLAVIRIESSGYNFAVSHVGALGLMQIMPPTGKELAERQGIAWRGAETLFDPEVNIRLGVRYLKQLALRYDGNIATALAAYNWGPGRIDGFLRRGSQVPERYASDVLEAYSKIAELRLAQASS